MIHLRFHSSRTAFLTVFAAGIFCTASAALPEVLNHQGRIAVKGVNFDGTGQFKFAFVNADGTTTCWSNDGTSVAGAEPAAAVLLPVSKGLYAVLLGNTALPNMGAIPPSALEHEDLHLRIWFNDGLNGFQQITPDQRLAAVPFSIHARKALSADTFGGPLAGDVTGGQSATAIADATVTGKRLTGFASSTGPISADDSLLSAIGKLHGNASLLAPLESPTFTGTVSGISAGMVGLGEVDNTSDLNKPVSAAQQSALDLKADATALEAKADVATLDAALALKADFTALDAKVDVTALEAALDLKADATALDAKADLTALDAKADVTALDTKADLTALDAKADLTALDAKADLTALDAKAPLASPTFTGTVSGISAGMVGLGEVDNTSDVNKPVSTAQQSALDLKADATALEAKADVATLDAALELKADFTALDAKVDVTALEAALVLKADAAALDAKADLTALEAKADVTALDTKADLTALDAKADLTALDAKADLTALDAKAPLASPTFTGTVSGISAGMVGLGEVDNTSDVNKPVSTAQQSALDLKADATALEAKADVATLDAALALKADFTALDAKADITALDAKADLTALDAKADVTTLEAALDLKADVAALDVKAPLADPTFTGTVSGISAGMVGLGEVDNTSDVNKPVSTAQQSALDLKADATALEAKADVATLDAALALKADFTALDAKVDVTALEAALDLKADATALDAKADLTALDAKAPLANPTFTGTVKGISAGMVGLGEVDNTSDVNKPVSAAQQSALDLKADLAALDAKVDVTALEAALDLKADATALAAKADLTALAAKADLTALEAKADVTALDTKADLTALDAKADLTALDAKAPLASPTFTGTVSGISAGMVGLGEVDNTSDVNKPVSTAQQSALDLKADATALNAKADLTALDGKAPLASPTFTGTVKGVTKAMVGLSAVNNTSDASKPVSTAQQTALDLKANLASPVFTGTVVLPGGSSSSAPLQLATGTSLTTPVFGSVEFDGNNLYLTTNSAAPTRKAVVLSDSGSSAQVPLASVVAAPLKPVVGWGENTNGQVTVPSLVNVANIACGASHSLALLDNGSVLAWGLNSKGQTTVPSTAIGITEITAGAEHNLVRKSDGTLIAWGNNAYGQCTIPANINTAAKVAAGANHSLALLADGSLRAWGDNYWGQTTIPSGLSGVNVTAIAAGYDHSLALTSTGAVVAWGRGGEADGLGQNIVPAEAASGVVAIAAGAYHSLALKSNGTVVAWGWNLSGQVTDPGSWSGITGIAAGYGFSLGLKSDGTLISAGDDTSGQATFPAEATQITAIAAGANHAVALRSDSVPAQVARLDQDNVFSGKVGIARTPAVNALEVAGNASKSTAGSWLSNSDRRIKTEIESIEGALQKLDQVRLVDFRYTGDYLAAHPEIEDRRYPNVIAQEFAGVFPEDVKGSGQMLPDGSEILQVDTYPLTIYTAAAVQELHRENQALKQQISAQELRLRKLEATLEK